VYVAAAFLYPIAILGRTWLAVVIDLHHGPNLDPSRPHKPQRGRGSDEDVLAIAAQVVGESERPCLHGFFQASNKHTDRRWLLLLQHGWLDILKAQDPELVGDEVQAPKGDLVTWLHLLSVIANVEDEAHLKHDESIRERPLPSAPIVRRI